MTLESPAHTSVSSVGITSPSPSLRLQRAQAASQRLRLRLHLVCNLHLLILRTQLNSTQETRQPRACRSLPLAFLLLRTAPRHETVPRFVPGGARYSQLPRLRAIARSGDCVERCIQAATAFLPALLEYLSILKAGWLARVNFCERYTVGPDVTHAPQQGVQQVAQCSSIHVRASALSREVTSIPACPEDCLAPSHTQVVPLAVRCDPSKKSRKDATFEARSPGGSRRFQASGPTNSRSGALGAS
eukprot:scaffold76459_cov76-Phaeocystis_antarctica.AAC.1